MFDDMTVLQFERWMTKWGIWYHSAMCYKGLWRITMYQSDRNLDSKNISASMRIFMSENTSLKRAWNKLRKEVESNNAYA